MAAPGSPPEPARGIPITTRSTHKVEFVYRNGAVEVDTFITGRFALATLLPAITEYAARETLALDLVEDVDRQAAMEEGSGDRVERVKLLTEEQPDGSIVILDAFPALGTDHLDALKRRAVEEDIDLWDLDADTDRT